MLLFVVFEQELVQFIVLLFIECCLVGFLLLVVDYMEEELDLNVYCIWCLVVMFFVRVIGDLMKEMGLYFGDLMVVDKVEKFMQGDIVIVEIDGEFIVKCLQLKFCIVLLLINLVYFMFYLEELQIFGVVMVFIYKIWSID